MTKNIKRVAISVLFAAFIASCTLGIVLAPRTVSLAGELTAEIELESNYALGTEFLIPASNMVVGNKEYDAEVVLRYPDGNAVSTDVATLSVQGKYVLEYRANTSDGICSVTKEFNVSQHLYEVGKNSTASFGTVQNAESRPGIVASLKYGDKLYYNKVINLNGKKKSDNLATLFVNPQKQGLADALNVVFVLTDLYNSDNFITIKCKRLDRDPLEFAWQEVLTYVTANAAGQAPIGLEKSSKDTASNYILYGGIGYLLHRNDIYGTPIKFSMSGVPFVETADELLPGETAARVKVDENKNPLIGSPEDIADQSIELSMDYAKRCVYINGSLVIDLDDVTFFPSIQWNGFLTGECLLSVYAAEYNQDDFNFVLTEVDGLQGENLNLDYIIDTTAPEIELDFGEYSESEVPSAVVGRSYPIPAVSVTDDLDRAVNVSAKVYRDYRQLSQANVTLKNGAFTPTRKGLYTVVYTATDASGNSSECRFDVNAEVCDEPLDISFDGGDTAGDTGDTIHVPVATVLNAHGKSAVSITAKYGEGLESIKVETEGANAYTFIPLYAGSWTIEYVYSDYLESKTENKEIRINGSVVPYFPTDAALPKYVIKGATYDLPVLKAYDFTSSTPIEIYADAFIKQDQGAETELSDNKFTASGNSSVTIIYRAGEENISEKKYTIPVIDVGFSQGNLRMQDYFYGSSFSKVAGEDRISLTTTENGTQSFEFINALQVFDFKTIFHVNEAANNFDAINIYLQDSKNRDIEVKVTYAKRDDGVRFSVNDSATTYQTSANFNGSVDDFRLLYSNSTRKIACSTEFGVVILKDMNGNAFNGFPSGNVYMRVEFVGVSGAAGIEILKINNQQFSNLAFDTIEPELSKAPILGERYIGNKITLKATYAQDVLSPITGFMMYVKTPSGRYAESTDGVIIDEDADPMRDYEIVLNEYGKYTYYCECYDSLYDEPAIYRYVITVVDTETPKVTLGLKKTTAKVGNTVVVAAVSATDNRTSAANIKVMKKVLLPNGVILSLPGNSFKATMAGEYTVFYFVYDESFNLTVLNYVITVS